VQDAPHVLQAEYSKSYTRLYQTFIILSDVGDEFATEIEPEVGDVV
jgi:hypothetical protein